MTKRIDIECLFAPGCTSRKDTLALAESIVKELGLTADIRESAVIAQEDVTKQRFLGSPSIRINGRDIEPGADARTDFGMG